MNNESIYKTVIVSLAIGLFLFILGDIYKRLETLQKGLNENEVKDATNASANLNQPAKTPCGCGGH